MDYEDLKAKALAASRGPWDAHTDEPRRVSVTRPDGDVVAEVHGLDWLADAAFIACASPDVILALVERLERAEIAAEDLAIRRSHADADLAKLRDAVLALLTPYYAFEQPFSHHEEMDALRDVAVSIWSTPALDPRCMP